MKPEIIPSYSKALVRSMTQVKQNSAKTAEGEHITYNHNSITTIMLLHIDISINWVQRQ